MKIALLSDLHLSVQAMPPPPTTADVVVLAGDLSRPSGAMVPVPATNFPPLSSPGVSLSTMPRLNIIPALGPPTPSSEKSMANGAS